MSASDGGAQSLTRLEAGLMALISGLESEPTAEAGVLDSIWLRVQRDFEAVRAELGAGRLLEERDREPLERCQRLHVLATGLSTRLREELVVERRALGQVRERLRAAKRDDGPGQSCDVRG